MRLAMLIAFLPLLAACSHAPGRPASCLQRFALCPKADERLVCYEGKTGCENCRCVPASAAP